MGPDTVRDTNATNGHEIMDVMGEAGAMLMLCVSRGTGDERRGKGGTQNRNQQ